VLLSLERNQETHLKLLQRYHDGIENCQIEGIVEIQKQVVLRKFKLCCINTDDLKATGRNADLKKVPLRDFAELARVLYAIQLWECPLCSKKKSPSLPASDINKPLLFRFDWCIIKCPSTGFHIARFVAVAMGKVAGKGIG
jgi:hypothetical protein